MLLDAGADPTMDIGRDYRSALHVACQEGNVLMISIFCEHVFQEGVELLNKRIGGKTPMDCALRSNSLSAVQFLVAYGATRPVITTATDRSIRLWLEHTKHYTTSLHYLDILDADWARRLIETYSADIHACALNGGPSPLSIALQLQKDGLAEKGTSAYEVIVASNQSQPTK